jgi:hypothetical protein
MHLRLVVRNDPGNSKRADHPNAAPGAILSPAGYLTSMTAFDSLQDFVNRH